MKKKIFINTIIIIAITLLVILVESPMRHFFETNMENNNILFDIYKYGEASDEYGSIKIKLKTDDAGAVKELFIYNYTYNEPDKKDYFISTLQKLASECKDKTSGNDIDVITGATITTNTFKKAVNQALGIYEGANLFDNEEKVSIKDPINADLIKRKEVEQNKQSLKTGFGAYIINTLTDAENKNDGNIVTHEYLCAMIIQPNDRILGIKFDHISSNMNYTSEGIIPTGNARSYNFPADSQKQGYSGICSDINYTNMLDLEKDFLNIAYYQEIKKRFANKKAYEPFILAMDRAYQNAKYIGAEKGDTIGLSTKKELLRDNIINAKVGSNGQVKFDTYYTVLTIDRELNISSSIIDSSTNKIVITNDGKILGSKEKEVHTVGEMSDINIYSKIDRKSFEEMKQYIDLSSVIDKNSLTNVLSYITKNTDDKGQYINDDEHDFSLINFLGLIDMLSEAYIKARTI